MKWINLFPNYTAFLRLLKHRQVEYLLVGGYAVNYYGYTRPTRDLDIWTATTSLNALKMVDVFQAFGTGLSGLTPEPFQHDNRIIQIEIPPLNVEILNPIIGQRPESLHRFQGDRINQIEILTVQSGVSFEPCYAARVVDIVDEVEINIISLPHLQAIKQAGNRPKDLDDLAHL